VTGAGRDRPGVVPDVALCHDSAGGARTLPGAAGCRRGELGLVAVTLIGYDGGPLPEGAVERMKAAALIAGGVRHLSHPDIPPGVETALMGEVSPVLDRIADLRGDVVVLASGDPGFFGTLRALRARGIRPEVWPARSAVALLSARTGLPWDDAAVVSTFGRDVRPAVNACRALPKVAVLTGPGAGPAQLAAHLEGWQRTLVIAERVGEADEQIFRCEQPAEAAARTWRDPAVVLCLDPTRGGAATAQWTNQVATTAPGWAWPEDRYVRGDRSATKREVRALALAMLRPTLGTLVWDVGAGSGSVAVECATHHAAVIAIEPDPESCSLIRRNAASFRVDVRVVEGRAPEAYAGLPDPDAVFLGDSGLPALEAVVARRPPTVVATFSEVDRIGSARWMLTSGGYDVDGVQLAASRLAELPGGSVQLAAQNPVFVLTGRRR
jgi:precorrin-6Y C5,15-methyltransferase (decarboxylating)